MDDETRNLLTEIRDIQRENLALTKEAQERQKVIADQYDKIQKMAQLPLRAAPFLLVLILFLAGVILWIIFTVL